jgi:hypothetical protein
LAKQEKKQSKKQSVQIALGIFIQHQSIIQSTYGIEREAVDFDEEVIVSMDRLWDLEDLEALLSAVDGDGNCFHRHDYNEREGVCACACVSAKGDVID